MVREILREIPTELLVAELIKREEILPIKIVEPPPITPVLDLEQIYTAIRIADPEADVCFALEGVLAPGVEIWIGSIPLHPRVCIQRYFTLWGDSTVKVGFGIDTRERYIGPFFLPPSPAIFEFFKYWEKHAVFIHLQNTDPVNRAEYHILAAAVMPLFEEWTTYWKPRLKAQVEALKGK